MKLHINLTKTLQNTLLISTSVILAVFLCELLLRLIPGENYLANEPILKSNKLVYEPYQKAPFQMFGEIDTTITINSRGFRDTEFKPAPNDKTVVALGDSFTEGWGVDLKDTYVKQLQNKIVSKNSLYQFVYNAGHYGTNPKNYSQVYKQFFENDNSINLALMGVFLGNDLIEKNTPAFLNIPPESFKQDIKFFLSKNSAIYNFARKQVRYSRDLEKLFSFLGLTNPPQIPGDFLQDQNKNRWPYTAKFIHKFYSELKKQNRDFLLILIPAKEMIESKYLNNILNASPITSEDVDLFGFRNFLVKYCTDNNIPYIDLTTVFQEQHKTDKKKLYFRTDAHWNEAGHRLAANHIWRYLKQHNYLAHNQNNN